MIGNFFFLGAGNVTFSLRNTTYQNNSLVTLEDIGEDDDALLCVTDLTACCRPPYTGEMGPDIGNWFFPNGTRVPNGDDNITSGLLWDFYRNGTRVPNGDDNITSGLLWDFYRTSSHSMILLNRRRGGVNGIYRCEIPDALGVTQTIYIETTTGKC